jgi:predicted secreted protein
LAWTITDSLLPVDARRIFPGMPLLGVGGWEVDGEEGGMSLRFRAFAVVGVMALALCGCQKGNTNASSGTPDMSEAAKADSKGDNSSMKAGSQSGGKQATHTSAKTSAKHEEAKAGKKASAGPAVVKSGTLTEPDNEMEFNFRQGQLITVLLDSNRALGLSWNLVEPSGSVIVRDGSPAYAATGGKNGVGRETWHFRATKPGQQLVRMEYRRKWASSSPERTFRFTGTVR